MGRINTSDRRREEACDCGTEGNASTATDDLEAILSGLQPVLAKVPVVGGLPKPIRDMIHNSFIRGSKVVVMCLYVRIPEIRSFKVCKIERSRLLKELHLYKMGKEKLENMPLEKRVAMKAMTWSLVDLVRIIHRPETKKSSMMKSNILFLPFSS